MFSGRIIFYYSNLPHSLSQNVDSLLSQDFVLFEPLVRVDYLLFAEMLLQRPVGTESLALSNLNQLSDKDTKYMQDMASQRFDMIMNNLRSMPRTMLLTIR